MVQSDCRSIFFGAGGSTVQHSSGLADIYDVVFEDVVPQVVLHLEFAGLRSPCIVFVKSVVDDNGVFGTAALGIITSD